MHLSAEAEEELDEEEHRNREEILEEMRRHSRLATATLPVNLADTKLLLDDLRTLSPEQNLSHSISMVKEDTRQVTQYVYSLYFIIYRFQFNHIILTVLHSKPQF